MHDGWTLNAGATVSRIDVLVDGDDKLRWEAQAAREGLSLGAWLREAAEARYRAAQAAGPFTEPDQLGESFARCAAAEQLPEPDWQEHRAVLEASLRSGLEST